MSSIFGPGSALSNSFCSRPRNLFGATRVNAAGEGAAGGGGGDLAGRS